MESDEAAVHSSDDERSARSSEEVDDEFRALMEGLRTTIPGVMVLFSFLLVLPLQSSFAELSAVNAFVFYLAFGTAALASVLLITPSVHQRVRAPISGIRRTSWGHVMYATKVAIVGTVAFMISITAVVYLVSSLVFSETVAIAAAVVFAAISAWAWFYLPLVRFNKD